jgi:hypothetical protein
MPGIFDNTENLQTVGLNETIELSKRTDFCVGYSKPENRKKVINRVEVSTTRG